MNIGKAIKEVRKAKCIKQYELAEKCNISNNALCLIEKGKSNPSSSTLKKIFEILDIKEYFLLLSLKDKEILVRL